MLVALGCDDVLEFLTELFVVQFRLFLLCIFTSSLCLFGLLWYELVEIFVAIVRARGGIVVIIFFVARVHVTVWQVNHLLVQVITNRRINPVLSSTFSGDCRGRDMCIGGNRYLINQVAIILLRPLNSQVTLCGSSICLSIVATAIILVLFIVLGLFALLHHLLR